jgi:3',5'-cyclic AMP phosphodiesterase CpdA
MRTLLHLSDTHIQPAERDRLVGADTLHNVRTALEWFDASGLAADLLVISGDLANSGEVVGYQRLRSVLDPWSTGHGIPVVAAMGNHDTRAAFRQVMLEDDPTSDEPVDYVRWIGRLRVIALDCTVPGAPHGETRAAQLDWLGAELRTPADEGTVVVLHHPPTIEPGALEDIVRLRGADELEAVVRGTDVVAVLAGHVHHTVAGAFAGAFCSTAPAVSYTVDPLALAAGTLRGIEGSGFNLVRIQDRRAVASTIIVPA